jgi:hypothetical protein
VCDDNSENFSTVQVNSWADFTAALPNQDGPWIYRGQSKDLQLKTSIERSLNNWEIDLTKAPGIERQLIRDFRRQYRGEHHLLVNGNYLHCMALMQHHGAPTRLLDFTYSPYVAAKFAIDQGSKNGVVWCLNVRWCNEAALGIVGERMARARDTDASRKDSTFEPMYMNIRTRKKFAYPENPLHLNERLIIQQGVFLCTGDVSVPFVQNLTALNGCHLRENIVKLCLNLDKATVREFAGHLRRMNVDSTALFPGVDGFARSLAERLFLYETLAERKTGDPDHLRP